MGVYITILTPIGEKLVYHSNNKGTFPHLIYLIDGQHEFSLLYPSEIEDYYHDPSNSEAIFNYPFIIHDLIDEGNSNIPKNSNLPRNIGDPLSISLHKPINIIPPPLNIGIKNTSQTQIDKSVLELIDNLVNNIITCQCYNHNSSESLKKTVKIHPELQELQNVNELLFYIQRGLMHSSSLSVDDSRNLRNRCLQESCLNLVEDTSKDDFACASCKVCYSCRFKNPTSCPACLREYSTSEKNTICAYIASMNS